MIAPGDGPVEPPPPVADPGRGGRREIIASMSLLAIFVVGGAAYGLAVAVLVAGASPGAAFVGFLALPMAYALAMAAWRAVLAAWMAKRVAGSIVRSRGSGDRLRAELEGSIAEVRAAGPGALPGTWVFLPASAVVGLVASLAMALAADRGGLPAAMLLLAGCLGVGGLLRRLARSGRLPIPDE